MCTSRCCCSVVNILLGWKVGLGQLGELGFGMCLDVGVRRTFPGMSILWTANIFFYLLYSHTCWIMNQTSRIEREGLLDLIYIIFSFFFFFLGPVAIFLTHELGLEDFIPCPIHNFRMQILILFLIFFLVNHFPFKMREELG